METLGLKNINMLSKEQYENIEQPAHDELYVVSHSGIGFPSANYEDLELGATGTQYTAPGNGWFYIEKASTAVNQFITVIHSTRQDVVWSASTQIQYLKSECLKGEKVSINYTVAGTTNAFRFIYAEGE